MNQPWVTEDKPRTSVRAHPSVPVIPAKNAKRGRSGEVTTLNEGSRPAT